MEFLAPKSTVVFISLPIQPKASFMAEQNHLVKVGIGGHLVLDLFVERATIKFLHDLGVMTSTIRIVVHL